MSAERRDYLVTFEWGRKPYKRKGPVKQEEVKFVAPDMCDLYKQAERHGRRAYDGSIWRVIEAREVQPC